MPITTEPTRDQAETTRTVARLTEAIAMLDQAANDMLALAAAGSAVRGAGQIAEFARAAAGNADIALMIATNEAKLATENGA